MIVKINELKAIVPMLFVTLVKTAWDTLGLLSG